MPRKPKPTDLKLLANAQPCRVNARGPAPSGRAEPPPHLDDVARAKWREFAPKLESMGVLTAADADALAIYCVVFSRWMKALDEVRATGLTAYTAMGGEKSNPAVAVAERCEAQLLKIQGLFGCNPADRSRVAASGEPPKDKFSEFLARRKG